MKKFSTLIVAAVLGSGLTLGVSELIEKDEKQSRSSESREVPANIVSYNPSMAAAPAFDFTAAARKAMPAVVHIRSTQTVRRDNRMEQIPEQWREFFGPFLRDGQGGQGIQPQPRMGSGSGVIINSDGYIVTNNHVINNADEIEVNLSDYRSYTARVIGTDPQTDIAVIKIEEAGLPYLNIVNSDDIQVGEWVLAVGNPFNLTSTATAGIVSAKGRNINILTDSLAVESFIQTDAAVNPGNSGGALVDMNGNLIGVNTAIASPTGAFAGYAFAVPSNIVSKVVEDLMTYGVVQRGLLGVRISTVTSDIASENNLSVNRGAYVGGVGANSAAKAAGIKEGDVIVSIDGNSIRNSAELIGLIGSKRPGEKVQVTVNRGGKELTYDVTLRNREGTFEMLEREKEKVLSVLGAELENVDRNTLNRLGLRNGVRVSKLMAGKIRKSTDMREGFIITKIDNQPITSKEQVVRILENRSGGVLIEGRYEDSPETYYYGLGL
jgi:serine protease Do